MARSIIRRADYVMRRRAAPERLIWAAWLALLWERVWPATWRIAGILCGVGAAAISGVLSWLPISLHVVVLVSAGALISYDCYLAARKLIWPDRKQAIRRIEADSGLAHRPLALIEVDSAPLTEDLEGQELWRLHQARMIAGIGRLRLKPSMSTVAERDPRALRALGFLLLIIAAAGAGDEAWSRLVDGLRLHFGSPQTIGAATAELWITPPAYTQLPPLYASSDQPPNDTLQVPDGSVIEVDVHGSEDQPSLGLDEESSDLQRILGSDYTLKRALRRTRHIEVSDAGRTLLSLDIDWKSDTMPSIAFVGKPQQTPDGALELGYDGKDDYAISALSLDIAPIAGVRSEPSTPVRIPIPIPAQRHIHGLIFEDLTDRDFAGQPAVLTLLARDAAGHETRSAALKLVMPERQFHHPVARALIEDRRRLGIGEPDLGAIAENISRLSLKPEDYGNDLHAFLGMRVAAWQLALADEAMISPEPDVAGTRQLLWRTAIRIENGASGQALANLRVAMAALRDALARHASADEIKQRMADLRNAVRQYLIAKSQEQKGTPQASHGKVREVTADDIARMMARMEAMARSGDNMGAAAEMAQLQSLLESLSMNGSGGGSSESQDGTAQDLARLTRQQRNLLDRSQRRQQAAEGLSGQAQDAGSAAADGKAQGDLLSALRQAAKNLGKTGADGDIGHKLGQADQAMEKAAQALARGDESAAAEAQGKALSSLRDAALALDNALAARSGDNAESGKDPFGRPVRGAQSADDPGFSIPVDADLNRSREILDELRRRQGDLSRPQDERDYIDRLLQNF